MVNRKLKPAELLSLIRALAREEGLTVRELPGRGKGSHRIFVICDKSGNQKARFGTTGHGSRDMSWAVLRSVEDGLAHLFGARWMEKRR